MSEPELPGCGGVARRSHSYSAESGNHSRTGHSVAAPPRIAKQRTPLDVNDPTHSGGEVNWRAREIETTLVALIASNSIRCSWVRSSFFHSAKSTARDSPVQRYFTLPFCVLGKATGRNFSRLFPCFFWIPQNRTLAPRWTGLHKRPSNHHLPPKTRTPHQRE